jgi:signal transduction histidine kinase
MSVDPTLEHSVAAAQLESEGLQHILAEVPVGIVAMRGPNHVIEFVNSAFHALVGGRPLLGREAREAFPELAGSIMFDYPDRVYQTGETLRATEASFLVTRGADDTTEEGFFDVIWVPLRDAEGRVAGVVSTSIDVTEQVRQRRRIETLREATEAARAGLEQSHAELGARIAERTVELARTNAVLARTNTLLAAEIAQRMRAERNRTDLLRRLGSAQEDEQRRIARDLHDQVGQTLTVLTLAVRAARDAGPLSPVAAQRLADVQRAAEDLGREVHGLALRLRPTALDDIGLHAALAQLIGEWSLRTRIEVDLHASDLDKVRLPPDVETALYRVIQEALTNVARHARARHVSVVVQRYDGKAIAIVEDDGVGCDPESGGHGRLGLVGMRERMTLAGGRLDIESSPGDGTTVIARVPLTEPSVSGLEVTHSEVTHS